MSFMDKLKKNRKSGSEQEFQPMQPMNTRPPLPNEFNPNFNMQQNQNQTNMNQPGQGMPNPSGMQQPMMPPMGNPNQQPMQQNNTGANPMMGMSPNSNQPE